MAAFNADLSTVEVDDLSIFARPLSGIGGFELKRISLHPACKLFPKLNDDELRELADDIEANGLQNAIVLLDDKILDGRNRIRHELAVIDIEKSFFVTGVSGMKPPLQGARQMF